MGILLGRFRKKVTKYEQLEKLDTQITEIEEYGKSTELKQKKVAGRFMLVSVFVYVVTALIFYFYFFPPTVYERLLYVIPLITAPLVILSVKRGLTWWYNRKLKRNYNKLALLKSQKKKILDNVMETETYKTAKIILEKFAPEEVTIKKSQHTSFNSPNLDTSLALSRAGPVGLRYRGLTETSGRASLGSVFDKIPLASNAMKGGRSVGNIPVASTPLRAKSSDNMTLSLVSNRTMGTPSVPMARTILPRERTAFDKLVDYLVGDGPTNRYALICKQCSSHNGMALREEFEYLSFQCCYCHFFNPSKKQRPPAPKLGAARITPPRILRETDTSDSEKISASDSDSDTFAQTTRLQNSQEDVQKTIPSQESPLSAESTGDVQEIEPVGDITASDDMDVRETEIAEREHDVEPMEISGDQEKGSTEGNEKD